MASIFTKIIAGDIPSYKVAEDDKHIAFLDIQPIAKGHTLVVPKKETDYIFDLTDEEISELMIFAKKVARQIDQNIACERVGVAVIGLEVPHVHVHLVPLNSMSDIDFSQEKLKLDASQFEEVLSQLT